MSGRPGAALKAQQDHLGRPLQADEASTLPARTGSPYLLEAMQALCACGKAPTNSGVQDENFPGQIADSRVPLNVPTVALLLSRPCK